jgi:hypothetical protein
VVRSWPSPSWGLAVTPRGGENDRPARIDSGPAGYRPAIAQLETTGIEPLQGLQGKVVEAACHNILRRPDAEADVPALDVVVRIRDLTSRARVALIALLSVAPGNQYCGSAAIQTVRPTDVSATAVVAASRMS